MSLDIVNEFGKHADDHGRFDRIIAPPSTRPDLCAFLLLDKLVPSSRVDDLISTADDGRIWLDVTREQLAKVASSDDVLYLVRCGVRLGSGTECLMLDV
jgi:hypothetical protein